MSDHLDEQIRKMFREADLATPEPPDPPRAPQPGPGAAPRWLVPVAGLATAALVVAFGIGLFVRGEGGEEATATTSVGAAETTAQEATGTTDSMTATTPVGALTSVDEACLVLVSSAALVLPERPTTIDQAKAALTELLDPMRIIAGELDAAAISTGDPDLAELALTADNTIHQGMVDFVQSDAADMNDYDQLSDALDDLGTALSNEGAAGCAELIGALT